MNFFNRLFGKKPDKTTRPASGGGLDVPPQFRADLQQAQEAEQRYLHTGDRAALDAAAAAWERILHHPAFPNSEPALSTGRHERQQAASSCAATGQGAG